MTARAASPINMRAPLADGEWLADAPDVDFGESYSADEKMLHEMLRAHPMLSMEATSHETLQLVGSMFQRAAIEVAAVPIVPKSHDDAYLRPANKQIGERECSCGDKCICVLMARIRHGPTTNLAFVGTEFLLPDEAERFHRSGELPQRRRKCLVCTRYWQVRSFA